MARGFNMATRCRVDWKLYRIPGVLRRQYRKDIMKHFSPWFTRWLLVATLFVSALARGQVITDINNGLVSYVGYIGEPVFIIGSGFTGTTQVQFNGVSAGFSVLSDGQINVTVPVGATTGLVSVKKGANPTVFSPQVFQIVPNGPYITSFSPVSGSAGTVVTITGLRLSSISGTNGIFFGGKKASAAVITSSTQITATAPPGVTTGPITVQSLQGTNTTSTNFFAPSIITGFSPAFGRAGTNVVITGTNFLGATSVLFNGVTATFVVNSNSQITATVPAGATTGRITITAPGGGNLTSSNFVVQPTILSFTPNVGRPGTNVVLTGEGLNAGTSAVRFGTNTASFTVNGASQITAVVPVGAFTSQLSVTTTNGSHTNSAYFYLPPSIGTFSSSNAPVGSTVTIFGTNFLGATAVAFNGVAASFLNVSNFSLQAVVPAGFVTGPISVTTPAGTTNSSRLFYALPTLSGFSPSHGLPGTNVLLTGSSLTNASAVTFGGVAAVSFTVLSNSAVRATVPAGAVSGQIAVTTPGGVAVTAGSFLLDSDIPVPSLRLSWDGVSNVQLSWPTNLVPFTLQASTNLADALQWGDVLTAPVLVGNSNVVTEPADAAGKYYRLRK